MPDTTAEEIFEELKTFLSPGTIWQKVLVSQHDLLKGFGTSTTKLKIAQKVFVPFYNFTVVFVPLTSIKKDFQGV